MKARVEVERHDDGEPWWARPALVTVSLAALAAMLFAWWPL